MATSERRTGGNNSRGPVPDENGVMMYDYGGSTGIVYNPTVVATYGLQYHDSYQRTGDPQARQNLINTADWLLEHAKEQKYKCSKYSLWQYGFRWGWYGGVDPPYASALAQAEGINVLLLANEMTGGGGHDRYVAEAKRAFGAFLVDYDDGGVTSDEGRDSIFLQLLAKPGFQKTYVLNGHLNSLIQVWKYYQYTRDYRALIVFGKGVNWLTADGNLQKYYTGDWSYYDQMGNRAQDNYHRGHISQLGKLYEITGEPVLKEYCDRFAACIRQDL
ncbi:D-glucuronyl C5-epimerase [Candidatus Nitrososphaera evergladensis SR1]|uniref:D-glucuronyl C5-epimerase n=1 Tax=Candidatus Nitrososphaera evergladensis SR1 TaxID=1459636 RepID=A0A075MN01_9ARCH|nr:D-glucuronyl C5-epimerase family protein [Candidatus Nitrososphaera evergladensis]AIF82856.1 D-glucuronyl C5-epimerase [Candidatus Nitrososphaera evergladensis SR1]